MTMDLCGENVITSNDALNLTDDTTVGNTVKSVRSAPDGCIEVRYNATDFVPWDNPDTIISVEVAEMVGVFKNNVLVLFFLIGGPANVINMAVFYKQGIKDRVNLCVFALSLADVIFLIVNMFLFGEQLHLQFTTKEVNGPVMTFVTNNHLVAFYGTQWVSQVLSAIIATERCLCVCNPLKFQTLMQTRTMAAIIIFVYLLVIGLDFIVTLRYRIECVYDMVTGAVSRELVVGEFYRTHKELIDNLDNFLFGVGIPGVAITIVIITTIITTVKLRQIMTWRSGASSSISAHEVALTKMLIGSSVLFIVCITPVGLFRVVCLFLPDINIGGRYHNFYVTGLYVLQIVSYINSSFNIFVYYVMGSRYRETFWALFSRRQKVNKSEAVSTCSTKGSAIIQR